MSMAVKFADNIALIDTSNSIDHFEREVKHLHQWCEEHFFQINMRKTKELLIDIIRKAEPVPPLVWRGCGEGQQLQIPRYHHQ